MVVRVSQRGVRILGLIEGGGWVGYLMRGSRHTAGYGNVARVLRVVLWQGAKAGDRGAGRRICG